MSQPRVLIFLKKICSEFFTMVVIFLKYHLIQLGKSLLSTILACWQVLEPPCMFCSTHVMKTPSSVHTFSPNLFLGSSDELNFFSEPVKGVPKFLQKEIFCGIAYFIKIPKHFIQKIVVVVE